MHNQKRNTTNPMEFASVWRLATRRACLWVLAVGVGLVVSPGGLWARPMGPDAHFSGARIEGVSAMVGRSELASGVIRAVWSTAAEAGVIGFDVVCISAAGEPVQLNADLIPAENTPAGGNYSWEIPISHLSSARQQNLGSLALRIWGADGKSMLRALNVGDLPAVASNLPGRSPEATGGLPVPPVSGLESRNRRAALAVSESVLGFDATTVADGVYGVSAAELAAALNFPIAQIRDGLQNHTLGLSTEGQPLAWTLAPGGDGCLLYLPAKRTLYLRGNVFQSATAASPGLASREASAVPPGASALGRSEWNVETESSAIVTLPGDAEEDFWVWSLFLGSHRFNGTRTYAITVPQVGAGAGAAELAIDLASTSDGTHQFQATLNGANLGTTSWTGRQRVTWTLPVTAGVLLSGANTLVLASTGPALSQCYLDRLLFRYDRSLIVDSGSLVFDATTSVTRRVRSDDGRQVAVWDVTVPESPVVLNATVTSAMEGAVLVYTTTFQSEAGHKYVAFRPAAPLTVARWKTVVGTPLKTAGLAVDYLIITPEVLLDPALRLAAWRESQGLRSRVVTLPQLQHEFSDGFPHPDALKALLIYARSHWLAVPRFVVPLGHGTYDYRGVGIGAGADNLYPPPLVLTAFGRAAADTLMLDEPTAATALGRLPAKTSAELHAMIDRMTVYWQGPRPAGPPTVMLLADATDPAAGDFIADSEILATIADDFFTVRKVYNNGVGSAVVRALLQGELSAGITWWNYVGHGGLDRMGTDYVTVSDVPGLNFGGESPIVTGMTCAMGQFAVPGTDCLAEVFLIKAGVGPIAVWSPSGFSVNVQAALLNQLFAEELAAARSVDRLGDIVRRSRNRFLQAGGDPVTVEFYNLLGDPALQLPFVPATVEGRRVFYNSSVFDGDAGASAQDDLAIAPDKSALLPGALATFANYTSYRRGLNGVMVDVGNLAGTPTASDFIFKTGNDQNPAGWGSAPDPLSVTVRRGAGVNGSDRVTLIWKDNNLDAVVDANEAVAKRWLQVTVKATVNTGLAVNDTFYFGNAVGESGNTTVDAKVTSADALRVLNNITASAALSSRFDFNRDGKVASADRLLVLNNLSSIQPLTLLDLRAGLARLARSVLRTISVVPTRVAWEEGALLMALDVDPGAAAIRVWRAGSLDAVNWEPLAIDAVKNPYTGRLEFRFPADPDRRQQFYRFEIVLGE